VQQSQCWVAVVDDDASVRRVLQRVFDVHAIRARSFSSAEDYLARVTVDLPACLVLDINLGGMSGFELQDRLNERGCAPPIVFITARDDVNAAQVECRRAALGFLRKPFGTQDLIALVRPLVTVTPLGGVA
jgi:FixJ family two-component response regulator